MRNLIIFIRRYFNFFFFLVLEIICLSLVFNYNGYQRAAYLNSSNRISGSLFGRFNSIRNYFHLRVVNDSLSVQNAFLLNELPTSFSTADTLSGVKSDSEGHRQYQYFPAKVVNNSVSGILNYITIHRGREQGIKPDMGVVGPNGLVGIVRNVSQNYAVVMSLLNKDTRISALLPHSGNFGSVVWNIQPPNPRFGALLDIPKTIPLKKGDTVVTSGFSAIFPEGLTIGYVDGVETTRSSNFYHVRVRFATNFRSLQYVYVIKNLHAEEKKALEYKEHHE